MKKILIGLLSISFVFLLLTGCQSKSANITGSSGYLSGGINIPSGYDSSISQTATPAPKLSGEKKIMDSMDSEESGRLGDITREMAQDGSTTSVPLEQKIIKTGEISFEVDDIAQSQNFINEQLKTFEGYIAHSDDRENYSTLTLKVPSKNFDSLVSTLLQGVKKLEYKNIDTTDVSEEYYDVTARLKTKQELEAHYILILDKATKVEDILAVEKELNIVRGDIESMEGRLRYLNNNIDLSTIEITLSHSEVDSVIWSKEFSLALGTGLQDLIWFGVGLISIWPLTILFIVIIFFVIRKIRRVLRKSKKILE